MRSGHRRPARRRRGVVGSGWLAFRGAIPYGKQRRLVEHCAGAIDIVVGDH